MTDQDRPLEDVFFEKCRRRQHGDAKSLVPALKASGIFTGHHVYALAQSHLPRRVDDAIQVVNDGLADFPRDERLILFKAHCLLAGHHAAELLAWGERYAHMQADMDAMLLDALTRVERYKEALIFAGIAADKFPDRRAYFETQSNRLKERQGFQQAQAQNDIFTITISLEDRDDNRALCRANYTAHELDLNQHVWLQATRRALGMIGCAHSHVRALATYLAESAAPFCMVLEDDVDLLEPMPALRSAVQELGGSDGFDGLMLWGSEPMLGEPTGKRLRRTYWSASTTGYILPRRYVPQVMASHAEAATVMEQLYSEGLSQEQIASVGVLDQRWRNMQNRDRWYVGVPPYLKVREGFSDIQQAVTAPEQFPRFHWPLSSPFHPENKLK